tara:strand:+ start:502 stop:645 length:144 start_codon:yes stop_codon:yes gene_type:complete
MTLGYGLGMLLMGMIAILIGALCTWYVINKVVIKDDEQRNVGRYEDN